MNREPFDLLSTRRQFLAASAAGAAAIACSRAGFSADVPPRRPNLVYVFADQLRYCSCGYGGDPLARTPNMDRLASQGVNFRNAISTTPVCAYRASLFTGKYQSSTGMVINEMRLSPEHECFGHALTRGGYRTGYIGKWHLWANQMGHHDQPINGFVPPGPYRLGFDGMWEAYNFNHTYFNSPFFRDKPVKEIRKQYEPDSQTTDAIEFIKQSANKPDPFALFMSWGPPHDPWNPGNVPQQFAEQFKGTKFPRRPNYSEKPDPYADNWGRMEKDYPAHLEQYMRGYYAQTASLDANLGRLMAALEQNGLADNTILVFTSDHGEMFGSHGRRAKYIFYDEAARIPFLVRWPNHIAANSATDACLGTTDIMPTILSMMNLKIPTTAEGTDLSHVALGKSGPEPDAAFMQGMGATAAWDDGHEWRAMRDKQFTYAVYRRDGKELLFDNLADPYQMKDLSGEKSHAAKLADRRDKLKAWMKNQNDTFEASSWYRDHWIEDRNIMRTAKGGSHNLDQLHQIQRRYFPKASIGA